ncbi:MAG: hypothetical protein WDW38_007347 [Sanguina aurantia]
MGNSQSGKASGSKLSKADLERAQRRFNRLANGAGTVDISQFMSMPELGANPFLPRIFRMFDADGDNKLTLQEFISALEGFGSLGDVESQYQFVFKMYDVDGDGLISGTELYNTLLGMVGATYPQAQLEQIALHTLMEFDADGDGALNFSEFKKLLTAEDMQNKLALQI